VYNNLVICCLLFHHAITLLHSNCLGVLYTWILYSCDHASWAKCGERIPTRCNNIDDLLSSQMFNIDYCLDMFRASLCPSSGEKDHVLLHVGLFAGSVGCGSVVLRCRVWAATFTVLTPYNVAPQNRNQPHPTLPANNPMCSNTWSFSPDDGHKDAQNMSRQ